MGDLQETLGSFLEMNTYKLDKIVVAVDTNGETDREYIEVANSFKEHQIQWVTTKLK
jgi:hypothetical protein